MLTSERTIQYLKKIGYIKGVDFDKVEMPYNQFSRKRNDFLGIIDFILINENETIGVQACGVDVQEHFEKIRASESVKKWLKGNRRLVIIAWRKLKLARGGKAIRWTPKFIEVLLDNDLSFNEVEDFKF